MTLQAKPKTQPVDFFDQINKHLSLSHYLYIHLNFNSKGSIHVSIQDSNKKNSPDNQRLIEAITSKKNIELIKAQHERLSIKHLTPCEILENTLNKAFIAKIQHNKIALFVYRSSTGILDNVQENFLRLNLDMNPRLFNGKK